MSAGWTTAQDLLAGWRDSDWTSTGVVHDDHCLTLEELALPPTVRCDRNDAVVWGRSWGKTSGASDPRRCRSRELWRAQLSRRLTEDERDTVARYFDRHRGEVTLAGFLALLPGDVLVLRTRQLTPGGHRMCGGT